MNPKLIFILLLLLFSTRVDAVELFELSQVTLTDGPFKHAQELNRQQLLKYDVDRLLAPFLIEAELESKKEKYPDWESGGLDGHTAGHYMTALANTYAATGDQECLDRLNYMVAELARCQEANGNGYVGGVRNSKELWAELAAGDIRASGFSLNDRWVPWYNLHKTFAGLRDAWLMTGNEQARDVLIAAADWCDGLTANLSDEQMQAMLDCEQGGINEVLADVADITGDEKYLRLAQRFSHRRFLDPLSRGEDPLNRVHANTQIPKAVGFERIAELSGDDQYHRAASLFWDNVVTHRTLAFGGNSAGEYFPSADRSIVFVEQRAGPETCNTYNMLRLTERLFEAEPQARYADFYERALYNHILSAQHPEHGGYVYYTSARPRHYRVYSKPEVVFWCCVGTGMENPSKHGRFIYAHTDDALYVNLFIASRLNWEDRGLIVEQQTDFPDEQRTRLVFSMEQPAELALRIRHPWWVGADEFKVTINGEIWEGSSSPQSYAEIERQWQDGDVVEVELPMHTTAEPLPYLDEYVALMHGPIVLAAKTGTDDMPEFAKGAVLRNQVASGPLRPLDSAPMLVAEAGHLVDQVEPVAGHPLTFTAADVVTPDSYDDLELIPFFRLHDARYMVYWRRATPEGYEGILAEIEAAEQARLALDQATVDRVAPGEQQPETDHGFRDEDSETGVWRDRRYRHTTGWFSYDMDAGDHTDVELMVTYYGSDQRQFDIFINETLLESVNLDAPEPDRFMDVTYPIPDEVLQSATDGKLTVKFAAKPGSMAGGIYDVRLLRPTQED